MSTLRNTAVRRRVGVVATAATATAIVAAVPISLATSAAAATHVDNPFVGATQYYNPQWKAEVDAEAAKQTDSSLAAKMRSIDTQPTSVWMDRISAIAGNADGNGLQYHLDQALAQQQGSTPIVFNVVIYDLPGRDCHALASNGELPATDAGLARYKSEYIDPIATLFSSSKYANIRIVATIEPDSLPNITTNSSEAACAAAGPYYKAGVKYALDKLHAIPNVYNYLDLAHSGWLGWESNSGPAAQLMAQVAQSTTAGYSSVDGFVTDTANTTPLNEPFLQDSSKQVGGQPIKSANFYEWNPDLDEAHFTADMYSRLVSAGFPSSIGMLVDTSRNGWGGPNRPTAVSTSSDLNTYVDASRVDRRTHRGEWCNPNGAGIGERPQATPSGYSSSHLDAFVWVKPPGESDGSSSAIANDQGKGFDRMCDPTYSSDALKGHTTNALPNAPLSGQWFSAQFQQLVTNAYPAIGGSTNPPPSDTTAPSAPTNLKAGTITSSSVALSWTASTDDTGVAGYDVYSGSTKVASSTTTSATVTGLSAATAYSFTVKARDAAGNVSSASSSVSATTLSGGTTDTTAPSVPSGLTAGTTTSSSVPLSWSASTDNSGGSGVAGYDVLQGTTVIATTTSTSYTVTGLSGSTTYSFAVRAKDVAGNVSASSSAVSATTKSGSTNGGASCKVTYQVSSWNNGLSANISIVNTGTTAISGWTLAFALPSGQQVTQGWSATWSQSGANVTAKNLDWNASLAPGASTSIGFNGSHNGTNTNPSSFTLNGTACTLG
ncbi:glycoside hydrolase family 6 protein [Cellulomonas alba]|uniref:Glucanase n=1 Tax=Cellulomonas alba TaxID=3053467 RepID=A0ABT7SAW5_9CELL|nr:glycoside hydrolase family 6 protein [Cellulomonas alba]MDM7853330.1 glycoside hydrolase family 6 protein [Cellulomonas alba]